MHISTSAEVATRVFPLVALALSAPRWFDTTKLRILLAGQFFGFLASIVGGAFSLQQHAGLLSVVPGVIEFRFDGITAFLTFMVTSSTTLAVFYAENYLSGDERRVPFVQHIVSLGTLASLIVISNNMALTVVFLLAIALLLCTIISTDGHAVHSARVVLHHLLVADAILAVVTWIVFAATKTVTFTELASHSELLQRHLSIAGMELPISANSAAAWLMVLSLLVASAQVPFHKWLLKTLDAPAPLSMLLHAGIVNVAVIICIRMAPVLEHSLGARLLLGIYGICCASAATFVHSAQPDWKRKAVWSTIVQMGVTLALLAGGLYYAAAWHVWVHAYFKQYIFAASGTAVEEGAILRSYAWRDSTQTALSGVLAVTALAILMCFWLAHSATTADLMAISLLFATGLRAHKLPALMRISSPLLFVIGVGLLAGVAVSVMLSRVFDPTTGGWLVIAGLAMGTILTEASEFTKGTRFGRAIDLAAARGLYVDDVIDGFYTWRKMLGYRLRVRLQSFTKKGKV